MPRLFVNTCVALYCGALRLKPRERQLALLVAVESFGRGRLDCVLGVEWLYDRLRPCWRRAELREMISDWRRAGWLSVDVAGCFRLAPDRLPGWADCFPGAVPAKELPLPPGEDLGSMVAEVSQANAAAAGARDGPVRCENFASQGNVRTFKRSDVSTNKRLNVEGCENFAVSPGVVGLMERVRVFVGGEDWESPDYWDHARGWRRRLFVEEGQALERALNYVEAGLASGETTLRKTRGAMLWDEFQRQRRER